MSSASTTRRVAGLGFMVLFLEGYDVSSLGYATPALIEAWHVTAPQFTTAVTLGAIGMLLGSLCAGVLGDRVGRRSVLIGCVAIFGALSILTAYSSNLHSLTVLRFLARLGLGGGVPVTVALATDHAPRKGPRRLVILISSGLAIGSTAGGFISSLFVSSLGWQAIFIVGGLLPILLSPLLIAFLPQDLALDAERKSSYWPSPLALFRGGLAWRTVVLWIVNVCNLICSFLMLVWVPAILHGEGLSPTDAIFASTMYAFGSIFGVAIIAPIADRFGAERVVAGILGVGAVSMVIAGSIALPYVALCVAIGGVGVGIGGGQHGINSVSGALYPASIRATGAGWALGIGRIGQILGPLVGGLLLGVGWSPRTIFLAASGPAFGVTLGMGLLAYLRRHQDRLSATIVTDRPLFSQTE
jgi:AAHS family 4-hydroxybenzoate transporter-like MFS transporter